MQFPSAHEESGTRVFIFTGPPCSGKTTTIDLLKEEGYTVINEAALDVIDRELSRLNLKNPGEIPGLNKLILKEQRNRLSDALQETIHKANIIFCDRSQVCNLAYNTIFNEDPSQDLLQEINSLKATRTYEQTVFFYDLLPPAYFKNNSARTETYDEATRRGLIIEQTYLDHAYTLIKIPATADDGILSRKERMNHVLNIVFPALRHVS